jgi:NAD(P)-dependent dehydrogenase (short-subunit alcohol dehydrogenase family)
MTGLEAAPTEVRSLAPRFEERICLVTGGGRGIGRAVAEALAAEGAFVAVLSRTRSECEAVADRIGARGLALEADVSDPNSCDAAVREIEERLGSLSLLINAAGVSPVRQRAETHDIASFTHIFGVNVLGAFAMTQAAAPALFESRGAVVNVASVLGTVASPRLAAYGSAKAALIQLTRTLAREWADRGVRVNSVCPGFVDTRLTAEMLKVEHLRDEILDSTPLGRLATIDEVVRPVLFLGSSDASYITGASLLIDGGMSA